MLYELGLIRATHVGLDLSHSTNPLALVQTIGVGVTLFVFDPCLDGHDDVAIPCHLSVQVAASIWTRRSCIIGYDLGI